MKLINSKVKPSVLLGIIEQYHNTPAQTGRIGLTTANEYLQVARLELSDGSTVQPHKHVANQRTIEYTQEIWIVQSGMIDVTIYDLDDQPLLKTRLRPRDIYIHLRGGHSLVAVGDATMIEVKNGPYSESAVDKVTL